MDHKTNVISSILYTSITENYKEEERNYIGCSSIGNPCERAIWYSFHKYKKQPFSSRQLITFEIGKALEYMILEYLEDAGFDIERPPQMMISREGYDFGGTPDAILYNDNSSHLHLNNIPDGPYILEIKTAKNDSFKGFIKNGLKSWRPQYYAQIQAYMGLNKFPRAIILVINKDSSDLADELVHFDEIYYESLLYKADLIAKSEVEPERINKNPTFYICSSCKYKTICHV